MKDDVLGLNHLLSLPATCHTVRPRSSALSSGHRRMAPPKSSSGMPRCFRYHAASAALSPVLLKNTPPTPVTLAIDSLPFISPPRPQLGSTRALNMRLVRWRASESRRPSEGSL